MQVKRNMFFSLGITFLINFSTGFYPDTILSQRNNKHYLLFKQKKWIFFVKIILPLNSGSENNRLFTIVFFVTKWYNKKDFVFI